MNEVKSSSLDSDHRLLFKSISHQGILSNEWESCASISSDVQGKTVPCHFNFSEMWYTDALITGAPIRNRHARTNISLEAVWGSVSHCPFLKQTSGSAFSPLYCSVVICLVWCCFETKTQQWAVHMTFEHDIMFKTHKLYYKLCVEIICWGTESLFVFNAVTVKQTQLRKQQNLCFAFTLFVVFMYQDVLSCVITYIISTLHYNVWTWHHSWLIECITVLIRPNGYLFMHICWKHCRSVCTVIFVYFANLLCSSVYSHHPVSAFSSQFFLWTPQ